MDTQTSAEAEGLARRTLLRLGAAGGLTAAAVGAKVFAVPGLEKGGLLNADGAFAGTSTALSDLLFYIETYPTSPLILSPFKDYLPVPKALRPCPASDFTTWASPP
ncbi:MAG: copper oxidase, partial [Dermatophilaceae bacterium]|nr:copper oxidase [Dermatophilaceae bacterium]